MTYRALPQQWLSTPLENVILQITGGGTPSKSKPEYYRGDIPWMSVKDMNKHVLDDTIDHISPEAVENSSTNIIPAGTPIIATRMSLGKIVVAHFDSAINQDLKALYLPDEIYRDYLVYWYRSIAYKIEQLGTGTTVKGIRLDVLKALEFALPPLAEQKVIADKLDTLLAQVDNTKARLERIPEILKRFRQSVLAAAVSGRLTEEWRDLAGLPEWEMKVLGDVIGNIDQGWSPKCHNEPTYDESWGVIKTSSVLPMVFVENENKKLPDSLNIKPRLRVLECDILTTRAGPRSRCGVTCYVSSTSKNLMICDKVYRYRVLEEKGSSKFLALQLNSVSVLEKIETLKTGISESGMNLTQKKFRQLEIHWPILKEQTEIVRRVDQLFAHADRIEQQVDQALARVNHLTQSILAKAFRGELTEQWRKDNPELISGENSAEALLERIKAERAAKAPAKRTRKKATT